MHWVCCILFFLFPLPLFSQTSLPISGAASEGMAGSGVATPTSWSLHHNPSLLPLKVKNRIQTSIRLWPKLPDLTSVALLGTYKLSEGHTLSGSFNRFGFGLLSYQQIRLGWGHEIGRFGLGFGANLNQAAIEGYSSRRFFSLNAGSYASLFPGFILGATLSEMSVNGHENNTNLPRPLRFRLGASWQLNELLLITSEVDKLQYFSTRFRAGTAYQLHKNFSLRLGMATKPTQFSAGLGFQLRGFTFDYGGSFQEAIGLMHQLGFGLDLEK